MVLLALALGCVTPKKAELARSKYDLAAVYMSEENPQLAIATLREAVKLNRKDPELWNALALAYMQRGAHAEAEKTFKKGLRKDRDDAALNLNYGYLLSNLGRHEEAIERLEVAREDLTYAEPAKVLNNLGWAYLQVGRDADAVAHLEEAVRRQPNWCGARYNLGAAYVAAEEKAKAAESFEVVAQTCADEFPEAMLHAGEIYCDMGKIEQGVAYLNEVVDRWPGTPHATSAQERLAKESL